MVIDFHTHVFPDKLAGRAIESLNAGIVRIHSAPLEVCADGTVNGLIAAMDDEGIDISVTAPIATKPGQHKTVNNFALSTRSARIIPLAAIHPLDEAIENVLDNIRNAGFPGIKIHPEFQNMDIDDERYIRIFRACAANGLFVLTHAGEDMGWPPPVHSSPIKIRRALDAVPELTLIAAHMGGINMWEDAARYLKETNAYIDTSFVHHVMDLSLFKDMISLFGAERVLFGSDSPWSHPGRDSLKFLKSAVEDNDTLELITHINAEKLLNI